jgi:hypothetical protein
MNELFEWNSSHVDMVDMVGIMCMDYIKFNPCENAEFLIKEADMNKSRMLDDVDEDGNFYLFEPPFRPCFFVTLPETMRSYRLWTLMITRVENADDFRNVVTEVCDARHNIGHWTPRGILTKFCRDLIYYRNMKANGLI